MNASDTISLFPYLSSLYQSRTKRVNQMELANKCAKRKTRRQMAKASRKRNRL